MHQDQHIDEDPQVGVEVRRQEVQESDHSLSIYYKLTPLYFPLSTRSPTKTHPTSCRARPQEWGRPNCETSITNIILLIEMKSINPRGATFQSRRDVRQLTTVSKSLYPSITTFALEESRLYSNFGFVDLVQEIKMFNDELEKWRSDTHEIKNLVLTYHLYENLFSRLKYISSLSKNEDESNAAIQKAVEWFTQEKPKIRCQVSETRALLKSIPLDPSEDAKTDRMVQTNLLKRDMLPYELMSRTAHPGLFPPKEQLKEYRRKQFIPYIENEEQQLMRKSASTSHIDRNKLSKYRMSTGTLVTAASLKQSKANLRNTISEFKLNTGSAQKKQPERDPALEFKQEDKIVEENNAEQLKQNKQLQQQADRQLKAHQQEIIRESLVPENNQEDEPDARDYIEEQEFPSDSKKIFAKDNDPIDIEYAKELSKEPVQSSIRRVLKTNAEKIQSKLEDLDLKRNMLVWGKVKGKTNRDEYRKIQSLMRYNKYENIAFRKRAQSQKVLPSMGPTKNLVYGSPARQPLFVVMASEGKNQLTKVALENEIEKLKIQGAVKVFGRYINHIPSSTGEETNQRKEYEQSRLNPEVRSMSLTSVNFTKKKQHFSTFLQRNDPHAYNQSLHEDIMRIKTSLSKRGASIEKASIYKALCAVPAVESKTATGFYTHGRDLLSNPFFPKPQAKKKRKNK